MRLGGLRPDSQVRDASLAHRRGDGFDRGTERVEQLGHLAGAAGLPALLHDEAGQGNDIRIEGRLVRHAGAGLLRAGRQVQAGTRQDAAHSVVAQISAAEGRTAQRVAMLRE